MVVDYDWCVIVLLLVVGCGMGDVICFDMFGESGCCEVVVDVLVGVVVECFFVYGLLCVWFVDFVVEVVFYVYLV